MTRRLNTVLLTTTALAALGLASALAGPDGANVVGGSATIQGQGSATVTINQSSERAVINWRQFDIGVGESARFNQPSSSSVTLNRVTGGLGPTQILGNLDANGRVFVINRDGILIGPNAKIDTAGFLATTNDIRNDDFMAGRYNFNIPGRPDASIVNQGTITAHSAGFAALVAPGVRNTGTITATLGTVGLASGNGFTLDFYGDRLITLAVGDSIGTTVRDVQTGQPLNSLVENAGRIQANGGRVELTAVEARRVVDSVINNRGVIEANTVGTRGGTIVLGAATRPAAGSPRQVVRVGGTLSASAPKGTKNAKLKDGSGEGGRVIVTGEDIVVANARIDVSGPARGGTVLIGGDWAGGNPNTSAVSHPNARLESTAIPTAASVTVDASTVIDASATYNGDAGKVIVWADGATSFRGNILAMGGPNGGNGGFVEVSGRQYLDMTGSVDLRAPHGAAGTLLLDPADAYIDPVGGPTRPPGATVFTNTFVQNQLALGNLVIQTDNNTNPVGQNGDLTVTAPVTWNNGNTLTLSAFHNIQIDGVGSGPTIANTGAGNLIVRANNTGVADNSGGTITLGAHTSANRIDWSGSTGRVSFYYTPPNGYTSPENFTTGNGRVTTNPGVPNQFTPYMLVNSGFDLQDISTNLGGTYALGRNIDASNISNFTSIGPSSFTGVLDGNGGLGQVHEIQNLTISSAAQNVGLFSQIGAGGVVRNLNLTGASVTATGNSQLVGTVVGDNSGTIANVGVGGTVAGTGTGITAGGIAGVNRSFNSITQSTSSVNITVGDGSQINGMNLAGGLVGLNAGAISGSSASGTITGGANTFVGGLVGFNGNPLHPDPAPTITSSSATGNVSTTSNGFAGGLVGSNSGAISLSSANANVSGGASSSLGGLVGWNVGAIANSQASGPVTGTGGVRAGGLVGDNETGATISGSNVSGNVTINVAGAGDVFAGGLVGNNSGAVTNSQASGNVSGTGGDSNLGGLVGAVGFGATIDNSSASGNVTLTTTFLANAGGLAGASGGTITNSQATGNVTVNAAGGQAGGLVGMNLGTIGNSSASLGSVTANGANTFAGGLVGQNGTMGPNPFTGTITDSSASGNVTITSLFSMAGGLAGANAPGSTITNSRASGNVTSTANGTSQVDFTSAGGLVGQNAGTITGTTTPSQSTQCSSGQSCATGVVTVGAHGQGGGLAGTNFGTITNSFARGAVTTPVDGAGNDANTHLGGLAGLNQGTITNSFASGNVGDPNTPRSFVMAGGLVSDNAGTITNSFALGNVVVGDNSQAGGFTAANHPFEGCQNCSPFGDGQNNAALIANSQAFGTVTSGSTSAIGGFVGASGGTLNNVSASGAVTGADNSVIGGLVGAVDVGGVITQSSATGAVSSTGQFSFVGGLAGLNVGAITSSTSSGAVSATDFSLVGGLVGINLGSITQSTTPASATVTAPGLGNLVGGLVGVNAGTIQQNSNAAGAVTGGMLNAVGGLVGANVALTGPNLPPGNPIPGSSFPVGTITDSVATGNVSGGTLSFIGGQVGANGGVLNHLTSANNVSGGDGSIVGGLVGLNSGPLLFPLLPAILGDCDSPVCGGLQNATASSGPGTITHGSSTSTVTGGAGSFVGGLVGWNLFGGISESSASGPVTGGDGSVAGGLVALNFGAIGTSSSTGPVTVGAGGIAGGLVGLNLGGGGSAAVAGLQAIPGSAQAFETGAIRQSFSTGAVTGGAGSTVAGLVAVNGGLLDQTHAIGFVQGGAGSTTGGLVAINSGAFTIPPEFGGGNQLPTLGGTVTSSYWDPTSTGQQISAAGSIFPSVPGLPPGFDPSVWLTCPGCFPFLFGGQPITGFVPPPDAPIDDLIRSILPPSNSLVVANLTETTTTNPTQQGEVVNTTQTTQTTQNQPRGNQQRPQGNQQTNNGPLRPDGRPSNVPPLNETRFINDQVVVQIGAGISPDVLNRIARRLGLSIMASETLGILGTRVIQFQIGSGRSVRDVIIELEKQKIVEAAVPNYQFMLAQDATSPAPAGDAAQYTIAKLNLVEAHRIATGANVLIAVIDSEIDAKHPDLEGRIANRFDAVGPADKPHPHGTGMAGAIASHRKLMGVAPGARILAIRAFGAGSGGAQGTTMQIVKGLDWAISQGAKVVNMSFAGPKDPTLAKAFAAAAAKKVVLIAAAGNAGPKSPPLFPGAETGVIAVSATDADDGVYVNANRGKYVTVAAPGVDILVPAPDGNYEFTTGTSVAAAHVSGVAALLLQRDPKLDPATVREILTSTAKQLGKTQGGRNDETGHGLVDPLKALQSLGARSAGVTAPATVGVAAR